MVRAWLARVAIALALVAPAAQADAQVVNNPRVVEFEPSTDHSTVLPDGTPVVDDYVLKIYRVGTSTLALTVPLGKPSPGADGRIVCDLSTRLGGLTAGVTYEARVAARGLAGEGVSGPSNAFTMSVVPPGCTYAVAPLVVSWGSGGSTVPITVTAPSGCTWTASSAIAWLAVTPKSGSGNGTVTVTIGPNATPDARSAAVIIAGMPVTVNQAAGDGCAYTVTPRTLSTAAAGGSRTVTVTAGNGCAWSAASKASWLAASPASGNGNGTVTITASANGAESARSGTVTVAGRTVTMTQAAAVATDDLLWRTADGRLVAWHMNGTVQDEAVVIWNEPVAVEGWRVVGFGDLDGDGHRDLVWQDDSGFVAAWFMAGTAQAHTALLHDFPAAVGGWSIAATADLTGDGKADLVWQHADGYVAMWMMDGATQRHSVLLDEEPVAAGGWTIVGSGDVDGDAMVDLVWRSPEGYLSAWLMNRAEHAGNVLLSPAAAARDGWQVVATARMNADEIVDLVWQHDDGALATWLLTAGGEPVPVALTPPQADPGWRIAGPK